MVVGIVAVWLTRSETSRSILLFAGRGRAVRHDVPQIAESASYGGPVIDGVKGVGIRGMHELKRM